jgi:hypothetical protein
MHEGYAILHVNDNGVTGVTMLTSKGGKLGTLTMSDEGKPAGAIEWGRFLGYNNAEIVAFLDDASAVISLRTPEFGIDYGPKQ